MAIDIETIKKLRSATGVGITDAKRALVDADGDYDKAVEAMRVKGLARADKKADREAGEGMIESYVHSGRIGVLVEVNCETDFVARTDDFKTLAHDVALHVAAAAPKYLTTEAIDPADEAKERELFAEELKNEGKPADMIDKIVEGKVSKWQSEVCLMSQPYIKNPDQTVGDMVKEAAAKLGENIKVSQFSRLEMGG